MEAGQLLQRVVVETGAGLPCGFASMASTGICMIGFYLFLKLTSFSTPSIKGTESPSPMAFFFVIYKAGLILIFTSST
jgi:hypothetical protein